jgi:LAS superfamily LD-carboxypeptidase LdcB
LGKIPVLDEKSQLLQREGLSCSELIPAILRWSALPGASRHHWGTDFDVVDGAQVKEGMKIELIPEEFENSGPFSKLHEWLDENMGTFGFFRPYETDQGGVSPERWHLSYAPLANEFLSKLSEDLVRKTLENTDIQLKEEVLLMLSQIFEKYILNISSFSSQVKQV